MIKLSMPTKTSSISSNDLFAKSNRAVEDYLKSSNKSVKSTKRRDFDVLELNLANKGITDLKSLTRFRNLTCLRLQSNKIRHLQFIQNCDSLSELYLQNNLIQSIENCFRNLTNISVLYLNMNQLADLENVANELSYLKYLHILNLYENPIALEKDYHNLIVYRCNNLEIFDKKLLEKNERDQINKIYEPERIRLERQRAFLRTNLINKFISNNNDNDKLLNKRTSLGTATTGNSKSTSNLSIRPSLLSRKFSSDDPNQNYSQNKAIKEFSYFDWSKVKLHNNNNDLLLSPTSTLNNNNIESSLFSNNSSNFSLNNRKNTIISLTNNSTKLIETNSQIIRNNKNSDLPQVITIRYT